MGRPGGRWKAESQGFPTTTIRASEDINIFGYERFEIMPPPAGSGAAFGGRGRTDGRTDTRTDGRKVGRTPPTLYTAL